MQNFGQFWTTSEFDREYLRNGSIDIQNRPTLQTMGIPPAFDEKSGELWSTNGLEFHVSLDPLKMHFGPIGGAAP